MKGRDKIVDKALSERRLKALLEIIKAWLEIKESFSGKTPYALEKIADEALKDAYSLLFNTLDEAIKSESKHLSDL